MEANNKKKKGGFIAAGGIALAVVIALVILLLTQCQADPLQANAEKLAQQLAAPGSAVITLDEDIVTEAPLVVNGDKTIVGTGSITLQTELEGTWPKGEAPTWGMGCATLKAEDAGTMGAVLEVQEGASLTLGGQVTVDPAQKGNAVLVNKGAKLKVQDKAVIRGGRYANLVILEGAEAVLEGGQLMDGEVYNVINCGKLDLTGAEISGAKAGAVLYTTGTASQTGGTVAGASVHNVYVASGSFAMTGGTNTGAAKDGIVVAQGAEASVTGGVVDSCVHGLCNNGQLTAGEVVLTECGIMNYGTGDLELNKTTVDTSEAYCLANNGGKVNAVGFTAKGCDTCAVYNFSGEMNLTDLTVTGSRDANISNAGGTTVVNGAVLGVCRDKSVTIGGGRMELTDVQIQGTTNDKYGVYAYGGELVMKDSSMENISSTAVKVDAGCTVELTNVTIKDASQNGFQTDGGKIVARNVTMENLGSHGIYNNGGEIIGTDVTIVNVKKNGVQHKLGTSTFDGLTVTTTGNHGAYIESGVLTVKNGQLTGMAANGFYLPEGGGMLVLEDSAIAYTVQQGINNNAVVEIRNVTISDTDMNGIYNKPGGKVTAEGVTILNSAEHGINNKAEMVASDITVVGSGLGSNGIQNNGTMTLVGASISGARNHGLYNNGLLTAQSITVDGTAENGIYNDGGNANIDGLVIRNATAQGINNSGTLMAKNVEISGTGKNGVYVSDGVAEIIGLQVSAPGEHGINNKAQLTVSNVTVTGSGEGKNGIQNGGVLAVKDVKIYNSSNHGIYNNGVLSGSELLIDTTRDNGIYNDKGTIDAIEKLTITGAKGQGINNTGLLTVRDVEISGTGKNGIYNNSGNANIVKLTVTDPGEHGISNDYEGVVMLVDARLTGSGKGSNCVQNKADMTLVDVIASDSSNHGVYNNGNLKTEGTLTVENAAVNGIYNYQGQADLDTTVITGAGEHGVNNAGTLTGKVFTVTGVAANGIQNSGDMVITESAELLDSGKHGMYNGKNFEGRNLVIRNAYDLLMSNSGHLVAQDVVLEGTAHKALYNNGYAELYTLTVDGSQVINGNNAEYLLDNNGGTLDLTDATVLKAFGTALHLRGKGSASVTNVIIDGVGNFGIFVEAGSQVSGDGLVINNVYKNAEVPKAEGIAMKLAGKATMMDHVTLGAYDEAVTGSGHVLDMTASGLGNNGLQLDADNASYSGLDLAVRNAASGAAIYNKGKAYITDLHFADTKDGMYVRYAGWATLSGTVLIEDISRNPMNISGPENNKNNGVTVTSGADVTIQNVKSHGINNKGSFLAAADSKLTVRNVIGKNVNAINNQKNAAMTLGTVVVDGVYVNISMYNETTINSNSGNGLMNSGELQLNGDVTISNLFYKAENNKTDNSNGSGVVAKNAGSITGTGSITILGSQTAPEGYEGYVGLFNGIFTTKRTIDIDGDIYLEGAANQGIYAADAAGIVMAGNITVKDVKGNGIYINNATGKVEGKDILVDTIGSHGIQVLGTLKGENITIANVGGKNQGLYVRDGKANVEAASLTVRDVAGGNGIYVNNAAGKLTVSGAIVVENAGQHGLNNKGTVTAGSVSVKNAGTAGQYNGVENGGTLNITGDLVIDGVTKRGISSNKTITAANVTIRGFAENGIQNSGTLKVSGTVSIADGNARGHGIYNSGTLEAGAFTVSNVTRNGINNAGTFTVSGVVTVKNAVEGGIGNNKNFTAGAVQIDTVTAGPGINNSGTMTINGLTTVKNITCSGENNAIQNKNTLTVQDVVVENVKATIAEGGDLGGNGIYNERNLILNGHVKISGIYTSAKGNAIGAGLVVQKKAVEDGQTAPEATVTGTGSLEIIGSASADEAYPYGMNNGIFVNGCSLSLEGSVTVIGAANQGIYAANDNASVTTGDITVQNAAGNGIYVNRASSSLTAKSVLVENATQRGINNNGVITAENITIRSAGRAGLNNVGGTVNVTGKLTVEDTVTSYGVYSSAGTIQANEMTITGTKADIGLFFEKEATVRANTLMVTGFASLKKQLIQLNHANTFEVGTLYLSDTGSNGLRIYNNSAQPTIRIGTIYVSNCGEYGVAAAKAITSTDVLTVGAVYYENCGKGVLHGNIKVAIETVTPIPAAEAPSAQEAG